MNKELTDFDKASYSDIRTSNVYLVINGVEYGKDLDMYSRIDALDFEYEADTFFGGFSAKSISVDFYYGKTEDEEEIEIDIVGADIELYAGFYIENKQEYEYKKVGLFTVIEEDLDDDTVNKIYSFTAFDSAIKFDIPIEDNFYAIELSEEEPIYSPTIKGREVLEKACKHANINLAQGVSLMWDDHIFEKVNVGFDERISWRQIVSEYAQANLVSAYINENNELDFKDVISEEEKFIYDGNDFKELTVQDRIKPINSLVIARQADGTDESFQDVFIQDEQSVEDNGLSEFKITNNAFLYFDSEQYLEKLFNKVSGYTYVPFESELFIRPDIMPFDIIKITKLNEQSFISPATHISWQFDGGLSGVLKSDILPETLTDYELASLDQKFSNVSFAVNQADGKIEGLVEQVGGLGYDIAKMEISLEEILLLLEQRNSTNLWTNSSGVMGIEGYEFDVEPIKMNDKDYPLIMGVQDYVMGRHDKLFISIPYLSLAENAFRVGREGTAISLPRMIVFNEEKIYFHTKIIGDRYEGNFIEFSALQLNENKEVVEETPLGSFVPDGTYYHLKKDFIPHQDMRFISIKIHARGTPKNPIIFTEGMMSYTDYTPFEVSNNDILDFTQTKIQLLEGEIDLYTTIVDGIEGDIHSAGLNIDAKTGVSVLGKFFNIYDEQKNRKLYYDTEKEELVMRGFLETQTDYGSTQFTDRGIIFNKGTQETARINLTNEKGWDGNYYDIVDFTTTHRERAGFQFFLGDVPIMQLTTENTFIDSNNITLASKNGLSFNAPAVIGNASEILQLGGKKLLFNSPEIEFVSPQVVMSEGLHVKSSIRCSRLNAVRLDALSLYVDSIYPIGNNSNIGAIDERFRKIYLRYQPDVSSSKKIKKDFKEIDASFLLNLEPLEYKMKEGDNDQKHMGFIAEDVLDVVGDESAITSGESIAYGELIAPLVKLVQDQEKRITELEQIIKELI